jgi:hypothetical protein
MGSARQNRVDLSAIPVIHQKRFPAAAKKVLKVIADE